jgi:hypothetical protein
MAKGKNIKRQTTIYETQHTKDEEKQSKNTTQYVLDTTTCK